MTKLIEMLLSIRKILDLHRNFVSNDYSCAKLLNTFPMVFRPLAWMKPNTFRWLVNGISSSWSISMIFHIPMDSPTSIGLLGSRTPYNHQQLIIRH